MALQASDTVRAAMLDQMETTIGTSARLQIFSGTKPANCGTALSGNTLLIDITLPADWMAAASAGSKGLTGTWQANASAGGTASFYRVYNSTATTAHLQGDVGTSGSDLNLNNTSIASGQQVTITAFTVNLGGA